MFMWACGLALGMICFGCIIGIVPVEEEPSPTPPRMESSSDVPQELRQEPEPTPPIKAEPEPEQKKALYVHTVKWSGETVSIIAAWYTGDQQNWKALAQANLQINPLQICEGDKILIPDHLLKTREPLPREFIKRFYSKSQKEKSRPKAEDTQAQEEEPKLFGPKK
jgi:hypothetical protein